MAHFYKSSASETVATLLDLAFAKETHRAALDRLGNLFGGKVAGMHDLDSHFAGGVRLPSSDELTIHWCQPDDYGYQRLRNSPKLPKGMPKEERTAYREEHQRLLTLWRENCPPRLSVHRYWERLGVNTGNLLLCGGVMFEQGGVAYFHLGFQIDQLEHEANRAAGKPSSGWIEGAVEIVFSEYEKARAAKNEEVSRG
ncbi:hypothetical protein [Pseudomonas sp. PS02288]|uniref:hypothetical protein n=1 Tax=Pseudomonas sp. PS02288 TaxID=2991443 RepID=UPI00249CB8AA|nr:hypothetical protein [Pseudomonas sp. PS02288]